jgi:hypothetical protein
MYLGLVKKSKYLSAREIFFLFFFFWCSAERFVVRGGPRLPEKFHLSNTPAVQQMLQLFAK